MAVADHTWYQDGIWFSEFVGIICTSTETCHHKSLNIWLKRYWSLVHGLTWWVSPIVSFLAPKPGYSQGVTSYTQSQQTRQVTVIKPAAPSPASSTFSIYPVTTTVQPAAASVVPSYSQSPTYSTNAVTYSGKLWQRINCLLKWCILVFTIAHVYPGKSVIIFL